MAETTWNNPLIPLASSYGACVKANEVPPVSWNNQQQSQSVSTWGSTNSLPINNERERERDRLRHPEPLSQQNKNRPYPPSAYGAVPYPYPPAHPLPCPPSMVHHQQLRHQPIGQTYDGQQNLVGQQLGQPVGQHQQPLISSFGPAGPSPSPPVMRNPNRRPGDWDCPSCFAHNFASRSECFKCKYMKPGGVSRRPGDWWCGKCNGHNYAYRVDCFKCGADKSDGHSEPNTNPGSAERGRWTGDWDCPNCNAHCFASRMECFKCGEPKPVDLSTDD